MKLEEIRIKSEKMLLQKANVVGVMTGYKIRGEEKTRELSIICMVEKKVEVSALKSGDLIPKKIDDAVTDVIEVGKIRALQVDRKSRLRPCPMGTSGGHYLITAGTNGELVRDRASGKLCIGTNNHVGANSNEVNIGDPYLQPGPIDGGRRPNDEIGRLLRFVHLNLSGVPSECPVGKLWSGLYNVPASAASRRTRLMSVVQVPEDNYVDGAIIELNNERDAKAEILEIGIPNGTRTAQLDMHVQKSGRTTGLTRDGPITAVDATVSVDYDGGRTGIFKDQIIVGQPGFSAGGDSGSLILDMEGYAVGKLFAGSDTITIANHIQKYLDLLNADLVTG
ncbi:MAG: hypothetical protein O8C66_14240 [Candidatus Methanoperedens sp.]|nr:hypothetical protein [Candidatus Methanoperedens sp.]MCZ7371659.1 hypothetical protein [Candidatus Methanoperedens sp.]